MAASDFGTAIYTHCAPEQGLDGVAGMQFQSRSEGVDREVLAVIRRHLIYEPPEMLIQEQRPVEAFPPSFAHVFDHVFATAAGVYVGLEADGARQGNHLTHAIATRDERSYRSVRPVQMFGAPFWRTEPDTSIHAERLVSSWLPGPLDAIKASQFVCDQPEGIALLTAILSALLAHTDPGKFTEPRRVLFISDDAESVLLWLTAATLLIPQQKALRVGFKVFTTDPARTTLPVVAVHPAWTRSAATVDDDRGYAVFDLIRRRWTALPEAVGARQWVQLFCEADPHDVNEAVEMAGASGVGEQAARDLALVAVLGRAPDAARTGAMVSWLRAGPPALREAYGGTLVTALTGVSDPDLRHLRDIDTVVHDQFPGHSDQVRLALLKTELKNAMRDPMLMQPSTPRRDVSTDIEAEATRLVTESLREAQGPAFDAVLCVSGRFGVSVPLDAVCDETNAFVTFWADHPDVGYDPTVWPSTPPVYGMLRDELSARLRDGSEIASRWWNRLPGWAPDRADLTLPLDRALLSAAMDRADKPTRLRIVRHVLGRGRDMAGTSYYEMTDILWRRTEPTVAELGELCRIVPAGTTLDATIFTSVVTRAAADPTGLPELELCEMLDRQGLLRMNSATAELLDPHWWLVQFELRPNMAASAEVDHLLRTPSRLLRAHAERLAQTLRLTEDSTRVAYVLPALPPEAIAAYLRAVRRDWSLNPARVASIWAARACARAQEPPESVFTQVRKLEGSIGSWLLEGSRRKKRRKVANCLRFVDPGLAADWDNWSAQIQRMRWWHRLGLFRIRWEMLSVARSGWCWSGWDSRSSPFH